MKTLTNRVSLQINEKPFIGGFLMIAF